MKKIFLLVCFLSTNAFADIPIFKTEVRSVTPTIDTNIYASGELIGTKMTFTNVAISGVNTGIISTATLIDLDKEAADIDVVLFDSDPTGTTFTDQAAFDIADADLSKVFCVISITTDVAFSDNGVSYLNNVNCPFKAAASQTIYGALVSRGTPTYTSASDLTLKLAILQD